MESGEAAIIKKGVFKCFRCKTIFSIKQLITIQIIPKADQCDAGIGYNVCNKCAGAVEDFIEGG